MKKIESDLEINSLNVTGVVFSYYFICHRKMWLFSKGLNQENISGNPDVVKGELLHESRFKRQTNKEIGFDRVKIDFLKFGDQVFVHEIKKSKKFEEAHMWQLKYYIYTLQNKGINCSAGIIHYPESMRKVDVEFSQEDKESIVQLLAEIRKILNQDSSPKKLTKKVCSRCAYFDFCFS
jgi:CRISPR-associated exonuclease Cas4